MDLSAWIKLSILRNLYYAFSRLKILLWISFCICPKKIKPIFSSFQPADKKKFPYGGMNSKKCKYLYYFLYFLCKSKIEYFYFFFYSFLSNSTAKILMWLHFCSYWPAIWYRVKSNVVKSSVHMIFAFCFFPVLRFVFQLNVMSNFWTNQCVWNVCYQS